MAGRRFSRLERARRAQGWFKHRIKTADTPTARVTAAADYARAVSASASARRIDELESYLVRWADKVLGVGDAT